MKGPQGLGDAGAEAKTEHARRKPRASELLLGAFADHPPHRQTLVLRFLGIGRTRSRQGAPRIYDEAEAQLYPRRRRVHYCSDVRRSFQVPR